MNEDQPKPYESALELARKLAAVADPANAATPAERETAATKLAALCDLHSITPAALSPEARTMQELDVLSRYWRKDQPPTLDKKLADFAMWCLFHVVGELRPCKVVRREVEMPMKRGAIKIPMRLHYAIRAEVTTLEFEEWRDYFEHYATYMIEHLANVRAAERQARHDCKIAVGAFCARNNISLPESAQDKPKRPTIKDMAAFFGAGKAPAFQKTGKLASSNLLS